MSRKMIDYQVENGKISTIDGYKVGEELHFKPIYVCTTRNYTADNDTNVENLANGTWFTIRSENIELSPLISAEDLELVKKAKQLIIIPTVGNTAYGDASPYGCIITQATDAEITHPNKQGYTITEVDGKLYLSARSISSVVKPSTFTSKYKVIRLTIACVIVAVY